MYRLMRAGGKYAPAYINCVDAVQTFAVKTTILLLVDIKMNHINSVDIRLASQFYNKGLN